MAVIITVIQTILVPNHMTPKENISNEIGGKIKESVPTIQFTNGEIKKRLPNNFI